MMHVFHVVYPQYFSGCYFQPIIEVFLGDKRKRKKGGKKRKAFDPLESTGLPHPQIVRYSLYTEGRQCENTRRCYLHAKETRNTLSSKASEGSNSADSSILDVQPPELL